MKKKGKVLAAFCGLVLGAGAVGLFYVPVARGKDNVQTTVNTDEDAALFCGFKVEGSYDAATPMIFKKKITADDGTEIGTAVVEITVIRKQLRNGTYYDTVLTRSSLKASAEGAHILGYEMTIEPEDTEHVSLGSYSPKNEQSTTNLSFSIGAENGLSVSAGTTLNFDSVDYSDVSDKYYERFGGSYVYNRPLLVIDSNTASKEEFSKSSSLMAVCGFKTALSEYNLMLNVALVTKIDHLAPVTRIMEPISTRILSPTETYQDAFAYQIHISSADCLLTDTSTSWSGALEDLFKRVQESRQAAETTAATITTTVTTTATDAPKPETTAPKTRPAEPETVPVTQESVTVPSTTAQTSTTARATMTAAQAESDKNAGSVGQAAEDTAKTADDVIRIITEPFECGKDYYIVPCSNTNVCLTAAGKAEMSKITVENISGSALQKWHLEETNGGYYIVNTATNKVVDMMVNSVSELQNFKGVWLRSVQSDPDFAKTQTFKVTPLGDGTFRFTAAYNTAFNLDIYGDRTNAGAGAQLYKYNGNATQTFMLIPA